MNAVRESYLASTIHKIVLVKDIHGFGLPQVTRSNYANLPIGFHLFASLFDHSYSVAHIASKCNERTVF